MTTRKPKCVSRKRSLFLISVSLLLFVGPGLPLCIPAQDRAIAAQAAEIRTDWKANWDRTLEAAKKDGTIVIYGATGSGIRRSLTEGFEKAYPFLKVEYFPSEAGPLAARITAEHKAQRYDVDVLLTSTTATILTLKPQGVLEPIKPALILPEVMDGKNWIKGGLDFTDKEKQYNVAFFAGVKCFLGINTDLVGPQDIKSLNDLLDPKWKGKIATNDPRVAGPGTGGYGWVMTVGGPEYLKRLRQQIAAVTRDDRQLWEWVARGKFPVSIGPSDKHFGILTREGIKNIAMIAALKEGVLTSTSSGTVALPKNAPHTNAAKVFINWLLTKDGQLAASNGWGMVSQRVDVPPPAEVPDYLIPKPGVQYVSTYNEEFMEKTTKSDAFKNLMETLFK